MSKTVGLYTNFLHFARPQVYNTHICYFSTADHLNKQ